MTDFTNTLWQSKNWEQFERARGHDTLRVEGVLIVVRKTLFGKSFFEIPRANMRTVADEFWGQLKKEAEKHGAIFSRVFPVDLKGEVPLFLKEGAGEISIRTKNVPEIFPENTLVIDLTQSEEDILADMKSKGRYNIRLAEKKGVEVVASDDVEAFYQLLQETTARDDFSGHPEAVYRKMLESFGDNGFLLLAKYEGVVIAGGIFLFHEGTATYYYGASGNAHRNVMAPYLVQWNAMQEAKKRGCEWYDFLGIAPDNAAKEHRLSGVSEFKEKFGGVRHQYAPAFEIVHRRGWDSCLRMISRARNLLGI